MRISRYRWSEPSTAISAFSGSRGSGCLITFLTVPGFVVLGFLFMIVPRSEKNGWGLHCSRSYGFHFTHGRTLSEAPPNDARLIGKQAGCWRLRGMKLRGSPYEPIFRGLQ